MVINEKQWSRWEAPDLRCRRLVMAGSERLWQNELKQLWRSHVIIGIMGNQTLEYVSDRLLKVLYLFLFIILVKNNGHISTCWGV